MGKDIWFSVFYAFDIYVKQEMIELRGKTDKPTITGEYFNIPFLTLIEEVGRRSARISKNSTTPSISRP